MTAVIPLRFRKAALGFAAAAACALALAGCKQTLNAADETLRTSFGSADEGVSDFLESRIGPYDEYVFGVNWAQKSAGVGLYKPEHPFNLYMQKVGTTIVLATHYPYTYSGYSFGVIDDQPNAVAQPSGFIFVSRGLLEQIESEDELAAVLAHEIAHHELRHNMLSVAQGKSLNIIQRLFSDRSGNNSADEIMAAMNEGYNRRHELEADRRGIELLALSGYDPHALVRILERLRDATGSLGGADYPEDRHLLAREHIADLGLSAPQIPEVRRARFAEAMQGFLDVNLASRRTQ
jgi:predicted Zn-dependent protease